MRQPTWRWMALLIPLWIALALLARPAPANAQAGPPWRVVIKPLVPFVIREGESYRGFSIDLWEEVARRLGRDFSYQYVDTVQQQLAAVEEGRADAGITGISITREREERLDFSLPYFRAGLQIMAAGTASTGGWVTPFGLIRQLIASPTFYRTLGGIAVFIIILAHAFWLLERRRNPDFPKPYLRGVWEGIWYSVVTLVTVGYGDRTAKTVPGRLLAMAWMFLSLLLVAGFTANITSELTLNRFQGLIQGEEDLPGKRIATVRGSTAATYLQDRRLRYTPVEAVEDAYALLEEGQVDAIVYDSPVLLYYALNEGKGKVQVVGEVFQPQDYGIALPTGSSDREALNRALLGINEDGTYDQIYARWFGGTVSP